jgi:3-oxoacyl-[acyl-carrier-protein] synthase III
MGLAGLEIFIPPKRIRAGEISAESGVMLEKIAQKCFLEKPILGSESHIYEMGVVAAKKLLARMNIAPADIGLVIHASTGAQDYGFWSPAAKMQSELGLKDSFCLDISCGCHAGNYALGMAEDHLRRSGEKRYALIIVCDALSRVVDHADPGHVSIFNFADAASAILIDRELGAIKVAGQFSITDGNFSDYLRLGANGKVAYLQPERRAALKQAYAENFPRVIRGAIRAAGTSLAQIKTVFISQGDPQLFSQLAWALDIEEARFARTSSRLGHMGGSDIFHGLKTHLDAGKLKSGDLIILASSAIGFSWGATVLEI